MKLDRGRGYLALVHVRQGFLVQPQRLGIGLDVADGEGARRQHIIGRLLEGFEIGPADARHVRHFAERQSLRFTRFLQDFSQIETIGQTTVGRALEGGVRLTAIKPLIGFVLDDIGIGRTHATRDFPALDRV